jgi:RES domain-containing protein
VTVLWRISNHGDLAGLSGEKTNGRWHTAARGKRIVYLSEHPAVAPIEAPANLKGDPKLLPDTYELIRISVAESVSKETLDAAIFSNRWREDIPEAGSAGDPWLANRSSALLAVLSAPSPESLNYLFNPLHVDARGLAIEWHKKIGYDKRLFHLSGTAA